VEASYRSQLFFQLLPLEGFDSSLPLGKTLPSAPPVAHRAGNSLAQNKGGETRTPTPQQPQSPQPTSSFSSPLPCQEPALPQLPLLKRRGWGEEGCGCGGARDHLSSITLPREAPGCLLTPTAGKGGAITAPAPRPHSLVSEANEQSFGGAAAANGAVLAAGPGPRALRQPRHEIRQKKTNRSSLETPYFWPLVPPHQH